MSVPRRRLIRPPVVPDQANQQHQRKVQKLRDRLAHERAALTRWQTRLKRAFNSTQKCQQTIARIERQLTNLEG